MGSRAVRNRRCHGTFINRIGELLAAAVVLVAASQASAESTTVKRTAKAGYETPIWVHARWDKNCEVVRPLILHLDEPPRHGIVCAKVEQITIKSIYKGAARHCIGRRISGIRVYYLSKLDYAGRDEFKYTARYLPLQRTIQINVIRADKRDRRVVPPDIAANERQEPGPIPACGALIS
jgi:hypothetical protein